MQVHAMSFSVKPLMLNIKAAAFRMRCDFSKCENATRDWGDGSVCKVFTLKTCGPDYRFSTPTKPARHSSKHMKSKCWWEVETGR